MLINLLYLKYTEGQRGHQGQEKRREQQGQWEEEGENKGEEKEDFIYTTIINKEIRKKEKEERNQ